MTTIRQYNEHDLPAMTGIWNQVVSMGSVFPQDEPFDLAQAGAFFAQQSFVGVCESDGELVGLYILHPNNVGHCGHIANASYAVRADQRGRGLGEQLVRHSLLVAAEQGFRIMQFNAVTVENKGALHLYRKLGFTRLGIIPGGFRSNDGSFIDIIPHYIQLVEE